MSQQYYFVKDNVYDFTPIVSLLDGLHRKHGYSLPSFLFKLLCGRYNHC